MKQRIWKNWLLIPMLILVILVMPLGVNAASSEPNWYGGAYDSSVNNYAIAGFYGQCTWYCWGRTYELTGIKLPCKNGAETWVDVTRSAGYTISSVPRENSIAVWSGGHVAYVESVSGNNVTISESNWGKTIYDQSWSLETGISYYSGRRTLTTAQMNSRWGTLLGYIYVGNDPNPSDKVAPTISKVSKEDWNIGSLGIFVTCDASDNVGIKETGFWAWTEENGEDDKHWYGGTLENGTHAWAYVELSNHGYAMGKYRIQAVVKDAAGNETKKEMTVELKKESLPSVNRATIKDGTYTILNGAKYYMDVLNEATENGSKVVNNTFVGSTAQRLRFVYQGNGNYLIYPECANGKVLDVYRGDSLTAPIDPGDYIDIFDANDPDAQLFKVIPTGNGSYALALASNTNYVIGGKHNYRASKLYIQEYTNYSASCRWTICDGNGNKVNVCNHQYTSKVTTQPNCINNGVRIYTCSDCGDSYKETVNKTGHSYVKSVIEPTYTAQGYTLYKCSACGDSYKTDYTAQLQKPESEPTPTPVPDPKPDNGSNQDNTTKPGDGTNSSTDQKPENNTGSGQEKPQAPQPDNSSVLLPGAMHTTQNVTYQITTIGIQSGEVSIQKVSDKNMTSVSIPASIKINGTTFKITEIASGAFQNCTNLTKVSINKNVRTIGNKAFYNCKKLQTVSGCGGVAKIGSKAFAGCVKLTTVGSKVKITK